MFMVIRPHDPRATDRTTLATVSIDGEEFPNLDSFSYSSDVMQIGDPFAVSIPDPRGRHAQKFRRGASVVFSLSNPGVAGGAKTTKVQKGILVRRRRSSDLGSGTVTALEGADLGWHL